MNEPTTYEIVIRGRAGRRLLRPLLDDFACHLAADETRLVGTVRDAAHLHGVVAHLTAVNAELVSIAPVNSNHHHNHTETTTNTVTNNTINWSTQQ